jgi:hypothetical protein
MTTNKKRWCCSVCSFKTEWTTLENANKIGLKHYLLNHTLEGHRGLAGLLA